MKESEEKKQSRNRRRDDSWHLSRALILVAAILGAAVQMVAEPMPQAPAAGSQAAAGGNAALQEKLAAVKQSAAENQQKLHGYEWIETQQISLKGNDKPGKQSKCQYGPDGKVQKTPLTPPGGAPPQQQQAAAGGGRGGRLKEKVVEKKTAEVKDEAAGVQKVIAMYVPPDPQKMQAAFEAKKASLSAGQLVFTDYAQPGDKMTISYDPAAKKITSLNVNSYMDDPKDTVTLAVTFASLPDGTNYVQQSVLSASQNQLKVTTTNSQYTLVGQ
jgi:hypothetical protein